MPAQAAADPADPWLERSGEVHGNERLTAHAAVVLLLLLAAEGVTIVLLRPLLTAHVFIGMLLVPPVGLKLASVGYRFIRYYTGSRPYRRKGPPLLPMRVLGPLVALSTVTVFGSGIGLLATGPDAGWLVTIHKASFIVWFAVMTVHVLAYAWRLPRLVRADWRGAGHVRGAATRLALLGASLLAGLVLAATTVQLAAPWLTALTGR